MVYGVILAGGIGSRMGTAEKPKQFLLLGQKPLMIHTLEKFVVHSGIDKVIVLCPTQWIAYTQGLIQKYLPAGCDIPVLEGGATRNLTIMNAISYIEKQGDLDKDTIIVTHDAVRPFLTSRIISDNISAAKEFGSCDTVIPASDTIVHSTDHQFITTIPARPDMYQGQTPQSFHALRLREVYESLTEEEKDILTDACKIMVIKGEPVRLVMGEVSNIKITFPYDLKVAEALLADESH